MDADETAAVKSILSIRHFLLCAALYGFAVVATPRGQSLLMESRELGALECFDNTIHVENDPWTAYGEVLNAVVPSNMRPPSPPRFRVEFVEIKD